MKKFMTVFFVLFFFQVCAWSQAVTHKEKKNLVEAAKSIQDSIEREPVISVKDVALWKLEIRAADSARIVDSLRTAGYGAELDEFFSRDTAKVEPVFAPVVAGQILGQNVFVWAWDYYVLDKNYAHTGPSYWKRNFREGWKWDHNHWAINFYGHPYQGSYYYSAARAGGYGFYQSVVWAALGSSIWEMFCETEYPAPNDLMTTSIGGSMYGEVLYRLSRLAYSNSDVPWYRELAAFIFHPMAYSQRKMFGSRDFRTGWVPVELVIAAGGGSRFGSDYRIGNQGADNLDQQWNDHYGMTSLFLEYGKPYTRVKEPFDYFKVEMFNETGFEGNVLQLDIMGKLKNAGLHGRGHWLDFSLNLDFDTFYGDLATVSTLSLGAALDIALWLTPDLRFRIMNQIYYIMLGTADMGYDDLIQEVHPEYVSDKDNYQYNTGVKYSLMTEVLYKKKFRVYNKVVADVLHTIPGSTPHYGAEGWDFLVVNQSAMEYRILDWLDLGSRLDTYLKLAAYSTDLFEPMSRRIFCFSTYLNFHLMGGR